MEAKVDLPKQLPSRLTTLQKACLAAVFNANPGICPAESMVGHAVVHIPIVPVPLEGPVYFVSHGGEAFPDVVMVLQGYDITIDLVGNTYIKKGITSTTFKSIPDAPVSGFDLKLPTGKFSILGANVPQSAHYSLCGQKLTMPTEITGQNGAEVHQNTKITVAGCPTAISISSHKVKGKSSTLSVYVPGPGKLTASGKGLTSVSKTATGQETITVALSQKKAGKVKTKIKLTFTPSKGAKQSKTLTVEFKR